MIVNPGKKYPCYNVSNPYRVHLNLNLYNRNQSDKETLTLKIIRKMRKITKIMIR